MFNFNIFKFYLTNFIFVYHYLILENLKKEVFLNVYWKISYFFCLKFSRHKIPYSMKFFILRSKIVFFIKNPVWKNLIHVLLNMQQNNFLNVNQKFHTKFLTKIEIFESELNNFILVWNFSFYLYEIFHFTFKNRCFY